MSKGITPDIVKRLVERYGEDWFTYQPPNAEPFIRMENTEIRSPDPITASLNSEICGYTPQDDEYLVVSLYGLKGIVASPNPDWLGLTPRALTPYDLQGRVFWSPRVQRNLLFPAASQTREEIVYTNVVGASLPASSPGLSLLKEYQRPHLLVLPGKRIVIQIDFRNPEGGMDPPPIEELPWYLLGELRGWCVYDRGPQKGRLYQRGPQRSTGRRR